MIAATLENSKPVTASTAFVPLYFLALLAPQSLFDNDLAVPRGRARGIPVKVDVPTYIECRYEAKGPGAVVRAALMTAAEVRNYQEGKPHAWIAMTPYSATGRFRTLVMQRGDYFVLIDNRLDLSQALIVRTQVTVEEDRTLPRYAPAARRQAVTAVSLALFALVAGWSGWRLRRTWRMTWPGRGIRF